MVFEWFNKQSLIPYFTLGDPSIGVTQALVESAFDSGAGLIEIGIPFSDPIADGPVIQASHLRALSSDEPVTIVSGFNLVKTVRQRYAQPIVFMMSINLIMSFGISEFFKEAQQSGLNGVVIPDLPIEEATAVLKESKRYGIAVIFLVSPLCTPDRLKKIVNAASGFLYIISTTGTTGVRQGVALDLPDFVSKIRAIREDIPLAVGFGISSPDHVKEVLTYADGAIVGSHFVQLLNNSGVEAVKAEIQAFIP